nr:MAG TPA: hypothetical protein [Caudoviricetes sp.]
MHNIIYFNYQCKDTKLFLIYNIYYIKYYILLEL